MAVSEKPWKGDDHEKSAADEAPKEEPDVFKAYIVGSTPFPTAIALVLRASWAAEDI